MKSAIRVAAVSKPRNVLHEILRKSLVVGIRFGFKLWFRVGVKVRVKAWFKIGLPLRLEHRRSRLGQPPPK